MSSTYRTSDDICLIHALKEGTQIESELRVLLAEHVKLHRVTDRSRQHWASEAEAPSHGQGHMLPSPEEKFNTATDRLSICFVESKHPLDCEEFAVRHHIPADVQAAISAFLNECQKEARPLAKSEALEAIRRIFPDLEISDADLVDAIISEASMAGIDIDYDVAKTPDTLKRKSLERWDDEGGAIGKSPRTEAQRRIDNDTSGAKRRAKAVKDRNDLI